MNLWQRKLLAFLHDPPEKAYDYSPEHGKRAEHYAERVGLNLADWRDKLADHTAAAADRFIFPATKRKQDGRWVDTGVRGLGEGLQFIHPLTGEKLQEVKFPTEDEALGFCRDAFPDFAGIDDPQLRFWLIWRLWRHYTVDQPRAKQFALGLASLPADTRIPDATIWHHDAIVSALEAARDAEGRFAPALLLFHIGPVQEFIAQARSTRDAWSGSYLLSWMMAHAMKLLADKLGPDCVIYPSLRGQPLYDWLEQEKLKLAFHRTTEAKTSRSFWEDNDLPRHQELALTPSLPNRFLAVVPSDFDAQHLERVFSAEGWNSEKPDVEISEWARIVRACWRFLPKERMPESAESLWHFQVHHFWEVAWQLWPWQEIGPAMETFKTIPLGKTSPLHAGRKVALEIPNPHKDTRCYAYDLTEIANAGWAWSAHYQLVAHRLDARRQTRVFQGWPSSGKPGHKDHFSGKEEAIATSDWLKVARQNTSLCHLFRHNDELGAPNLIKRVWHKAYLAERGFSSQVFKFDSVLAIAAAPWKEKVLGAMKQGSAAYQAFLDFRLAVEQSKPILDFDFESVAGTPDSKWLDKVDASVFQESFWSNLDLAGAEETSSRDAASGSLRSLLKTAEAGRPGRYFAVLALDGDHIGKWLSGEMTPSIEKLVTSRAAQYFREHVNGKDVRSWLESQRPLSPSYHLQFSEALANFGLYAARRIVEAHHGQLIYSGGDDVLAMLPAGEAIACAQGLRIAFQGLPQLAEVYPGLFTRTAEGFIQLADNGVSQQGGGNRGCRRPPEPSWPLIVPGPKATVSVGLAIAHIKEPLQDLIKEAQAAQKLAKATPSKGGWDRAALAVTLFKRSGEMIKWGAKLNSPAFDLLAYLRDHYRVPLGGPSKEMPISGKFPYRLAELLERYDAGAPLSQDLREIAAREVAWAIHRQTWSKAKAAENGSPFDPDELKRRCEVYLDDLLSFASSGPGDAGTPSPRPLNEFIHLFALEAFIARQAE